MRTFVCDKCKFEIKRAKNPKKCPYCSKGNMYVKPSAQDILNETVDDFDEIEKGRKERQ